MMSKKSCPEVGFRWYLHLVLVLIGAVLVAQHAPADDRLEVFVVNYPLKYFAQRIGGAHVNVSFPAPEGVDPAYWTPDIPTISAYQKADLILLNGAGYAKWVKKVSLPRSKMVDTSKSFKERYLHTQAMTHSHGAQGKHAHEDLAFTTWLDLELAARQADAVRKAFSRMRPDHKDLFQANYDKLKNDLGRLDSDILACVSKNPDKPLLVSHPVYDYFEKRYRLNIQSVHWEPDMPPRDAQWMELKSIQGDHKAQWMIWEGDPNPATVKKLQALGIESLTFDPCGNVPDGGEFLKVMQQNVENLKMAFGE